MCGQKFERSTLPNPEAFGQCGLAQAGICGKKNKPRRLFRASHQSRRKLKRVSTPQRKNPRNSSPVTILDHRPRQRGSGPCAWSLEKVPNSKCFLWRSNETCDYQSSHPLIP